MAAVIDDLSDTKFRNAIGGRADADSQQKAGSGTPRLLLSNVRQLQKTTHKTTWDTARAQAAYDAETGTLFDRSLEKLLTRVARSTVSAGRSDAPTAPVVPESSRVAQIARASAFELCN